ncbi:MAG: DUF4126 family protein [bacterium]|nr:DUF4126 family protein [bacterium]
MSYRKAVWLGAVTGLRSMTGLAALIDHASRLPLANGSHAWPEVLRSPQAVRLVRLMQLGELVADKLPFTPNRTDAGPLLGRITIGAVVGVLASPEDRVGGAVLGGSMAALGTVIGYRARKQLRDAYGFPDLLAALLEDMIAVNMADTIVNEPERAQQPLA